jgi:hypothetical protein
VLLDEETQLLDEIRLTELDGRDVDRDLEVRPALEIPADLTDNEAAEIVDQSGVFGDGNEHGRRDSAELRRRPADECLERDQRQVAGPHDRLVGERQFVVLEAFAEGFLDLLLLEGAGLHRRMIDDGIALG